MKGAPKGYTLCQQCGQGWQGDTVQCDCDGAKTGASAPIEPINAHLATLTPVKGKNGRKTVYYVGDVACDSKVEAWRYIYLLDLESMGVISNLELQPEFVLRDEYQLTGQWYVRTKSGKARKVSAERYTADFRYQWQDITVVEEVKGLSKGKPYSKQASNFKQYSYQATVAHRDDVIFVVVAGKSNGSEWRYFQQSHGYPVHKFSI